MSEFGARDSKKDIEELPVFAPKFDQDGLIPALALDAETKEPLMLAYMNEESLKMTLKLGEAVYYSTHGLRRSARLWRMPHRPQ